jgi:hypothetical protein
MLPILLICLDFLYLFDQGAVQVDNGGRSDFARIAAPLNDCMKWRQKA